MWAFAIVAQRPPKRKCGKIGAGLYLWGESRYNGGEGAKPVIEATV